MKQEENFEVIQQTPLQKETNLGLVVLPISIGDIKVGN